LLLEKNASGRAYNVTDGARTTFRDYFARLADGAGVRRPKSVSYRVAKIFAFCGALADRIAGNEPSISVQAVDFVSRHHPVSVDAIHALGFSPTVMLDEGMKRTLEWLRANQQMGKMKPTSVPLRYRKWIYSMAAVFLIFGYFLLWPVRITPQKWKAPENRGYVMEHATNSRLASVQNLSLGDDEGPEHILAYAGWIYAAVKSGAIIRMRADGSARERWVQTNGRPLGFAFDSKKNMIIADANRGLLIVSQQKNISVLVDQFEGKPILLADAVIVARSGRIYFSDASQRFGAAASGGTFEASILDVLEHSSTGRIFQYNPETKKTDLLMSGLCFANGLAFDAREESIFVSETGNYRILRYWLSGPRRGRTETVLENLPGYPDNLMRGRNGRIWVGLTKPRSAVADFTADKPFLREMTLRLRDFSGLFQSHTGMFLHLMRVGG